MEPRASLSLPCVPYEPGPWPLTPGPLGPWLGYLRPKRDSVCVWVCVGVDRGLIISWPHSLSLHRLTPHLHFTGYKTHILEQRHTHQVEWFNHFTDTVCLPLFIHCPAHLTTAVALGNQIILILRKWKIICVAAAWFGSTPRPMLHHSTKFHENWSSSCFFSSQSRWQKNKQTNKPINQAETWAPWWRGKGEEENVHFLEV